MPKRRRSRSIKKKGGGNMTSVTYGSDKPKGPPAQPPAQQPAQKPGEAKGKSTTKPAGKPASDNVRVTKAGEKPASVPASRAPNAQAAVDRAGKTVGKNDRVSVNGQTKKKPAKAKTRGGDRVHVGKKSRGG